MKKKILDMDAGDVIEKLTGETLIYLGDVRFFHCGGSRYLNDYLRAGVDGVTEYKIIGKIGPDGRIIEGENEKDNRTQS